jgi:tetratricopeptide (TPR) repeat protein
MANKITAFSLAGLILALPTLGTAGAVTAAAEGRVSLPAGLEAYVAARVLEAEGRYREAIDAYARALAEAPEVGEVRRAYASMLLGIGMADRTLTVLGADDDLGPEGLQLRALALAQEAGRRPELAAEAEAALRAALEAQPGDPSLLFALAQVLQRKGDLREAQEVVATLRAARPGNPRLVETDADLLRATGRGDEAVELYRTCSAAGPGAASCRDKLVELLVELDRPGDAGEAMLGWLGDLELDALMRAAVLLWEGGRFERSLETVRRVLGRAPDAPRALALEAHLLAAMGRHQEAAARFRELLKKSPDDVDLMLALAWSAGRSGDLDEGREWLERAWRLAGPQSASRQFLSCVLTGARLELVAERPAAARDWLERLPDRSLAGSDWVRLLAETYRRQQDWAGGIAAMVRVAPELEGRAQRDAEAMEAEFRLRGDDPRAWRRLRPLLDSPELEDVLSGLQVLQALERWQDLAREGAAAGARFPDSRDILFARGAAHERLGEAAAAEDVFLRLLEADPGDASAANYLGYMWADRGEKLDRALELISLAVAREPDNVAYLDSLGWVHFRLGNLDEAERWLRRAVELDGSGADGTMLCHLGEVLLAKQERDEGRRLLQLGLGRGCEDPERLRSLLDPAGDGGD